MLCSHYVAFCQVPEGGTGIIDNECNPLEVLQRAVKDAKELSTLHYGVSPDIHLELCACPPLAFVPSYLYYILFELLKNATRASVDVAAKPRTSDTTTTTAPRSRSVAEPPPLSVVLSGDDSDITVKISDRGGGIERQLMSKIWSYLFTTARAAPIQYSVESAASSIMTASWTTGGTARAASATADGNDLGLPAPTVGSLDVEPVHAPLRRNRDLVSGATRAGESAGDDPSCRAGSGARGGSAQLSVASAIQDSQGSSGGSEVSPLAGFGCGLPLSRLYAHYLGGALEVVSVPDYGTDSYLFLTRIGTIQDRVPAAWQPDGDTLGDRASGDYR
eukprot:GHVU01229900.1.p1 GENE.GHVU01229900.1~~GHVU01229900.1.p1  ORF type:complete len:333 (-),score=61.15 GHVU01229900.1:2782-3780(-)